MFSCSVVYYSFYKLLVPWSLVHASKLSMVHKKASQLQLDVFSYLLSMNKFSAIIDKYHATDGFIFC